MPTIQCPHCSGEYTVQLVVAESRPTGLEAPTPDGYAWFRRGDAVNEEVLSQIRAYADSRPRARRITLARLYHDYVEMFESGPGTVLSSKNFSLALREVGATQYRTGEARGYIFGTEEEIKAAPSGASWRANAERAVQSANQYLAATMTSSEQDSQ